MSVAALAGVAAGAVAAGWRWHRRAAEAQAQVAILRREIEDARYAADHDPLTGLPNRRGFFRRAATLLSRGGQAAAAVVVDLDHFKVINDMLGHSAGDDVLVAVAERLTACLDLDDGANLVARLGGDEFAALLTVPGADHTSLAAAGGRIASAFAIPIPVDRHRLTVTAAIGVAPAHTATLLDDALHHADRAMYRAKRRRGRVAWFDPNLDAMPPGSAIAVTRASRRLAQGDSDPKQGNELAAWVSHTAYPPIELVYPPRKSDVAADPTYLQANERDHHDLRQSDR